MTGIADTSAKQVSGGGGFSGDVNSGAGATFSQRLGTPAILYNGNYNELSENQLKALQSIFSPDEIKEIYESSSADKHSVSLRPLYVTEADVLTGKGEKRSVKAYLDADGIYPIQLPFGFLNSMYTRNDEGNHTTQYKTGKAMIQMIPNQGNNYYMDLGNGRIAFFVQIPGENGVFLLSNNQINRAVFAIG